MHELHMVNIMCSPKVIMNGHLLIHLLISRPIQNHHSKLMFEHISCTTWKHLWDYNSFPWILKYKILHNVAWVQKKGPSNWPEICDVCANSSIMFEEVAPRRWTLHWEPKWRAWVTTKLDPIYEDYKVKWMCTL